MIKIHERRYSECVELWMRIWVNNGMKGTFIFTEASKSHKVMDEER